MSLYSDGAGQKIGSLEVVADHKGTRAGKVVWRCADHSTDREVYLRTEALIRLDRENGSTA